MKLNLAQRVTMVLGAVALVIALLTTPKYVTNPGGFKTNSNASDVSRALYPETDVAVSLVRAVVVIGATVLVTVALAGRKTERE